MGQKKTDISPKSAAPRAAADKPARVDKQLAWILRRGATAAGVKMNEAGWVRIDEVLRALDATRSELEAAISSASPKEKSIFEVSRNMIRAHEGHWPRSVPVNPDALEASWDIYIPDGPLWHGADHAKLRRIASHGIVPGNRSHVRLETSPESKQLSRCEVLLEIAPRRMFASGLNIYRARNGVVLVRRVPVNAIAHSVPSSRDRRHFEADLQALLQG